eukprot:TRINITY_DN2927_c0_g2_i6.p1 TRINITY_DN2927_c0_g2~~TRINITY_DN2927_c0_g2_i6.p1  ORF type:complete len:210 (+),score=69.88 TRINITY_DN2927_c0_g2_i6:206-835(+)
MRNATEGITPYVDRARRKKENDSPAVDTESILGSLRKEQQHVKSLEKELEGIKDKVNSQFSAYDKAIADLEQEQAAMAKQLDTRPASQRSVQEHSELEYKNRELLACLKFVTSASESEMQRKREEAKKLEQQYNQLEGLSGAAQIKTAIENAKRKQKKYRQKLKNLQTESTSQQKMEEVWREQFQTMQNEIVQLRRQVEEKTLHNQSSK